tara:strand:- start:658 stop:888 length:231 start_codon:yes stop_codon:yes gene_type:complete
MLKKGTGYWLFRDETMTYLRLFNLIGIGLQRVDDKVLNGYILLIGIYELEIGIHLGKRRGTYVERVKDKKSVTASA